MGGPPCAGLLRFLDVCSIGFRNDGFTLRDMKKLLIIPAVLALAVTAAPAQAASYSNCKALNADYSHGVGKPGARDKTTGKRVTSFTVSRSLYAANSGKDRDG